MNRPVSLYFTRGGLIAVIVTELTITLAGAAAAIVIIFLESHLDVRFRSVLAAISLGLSGAGAYYLRRIYKAAFDDRLHLVSSSEARQERIGTTLYLLGRPAISVSLTLAVTLGVILSYTSVAPDGTDPTGDLVYLTGSLGFATGFLSGRVIGQLETSGKI